MILQSCIPCDDGVLRRRDGIVGTGTTTDLPATLLASVLISHCLASQVYLFHTAKGRISSRLRRRVYDHVLHSPTEVADTAQAAQLTQVSEGVVVEGGLWGLPSTLLLQKIAEGMSDMRCELTSRCGQSRDLLF